MTHTAEQAVIGCGTVTGRRGRSQRADVICVGDTVEWTFILVLLLLFLLFFIVVVCVLFWTLFTVGMISF